MRLRCQALPTHAETKGGLATAKELLHNDKSYEGLIHLIMCNCKHLTVEVTSSSPNMPNCSPKRKDGLPGVELSNIHKECEHES